MRSALRHCDRVANLRSKVLTQKEMPVKKIILLALLLAPVSALPAEVYMGSAHNMKDQRVSLGLSPEMKHHQLTNMRAHMAAIRNIVGLLAEKKFDRASKVAHAQLGLTEEMKQMCDMFENEDFKQLGLAFHNSGDELGKALKTKNTKKSLRALNKTMGYCVQCHEKFRQ